MISRRLLAVAILFTLAPGAMGQLAGDEPPEHVASFNAPNARLRLIERDIADRIVALAAAGQYEKLSINADINLRLIARRLLIVGIDAGEEGSAALVAGYTLANAADDAGELFARMPRLVAAVKAAEVPRDDDIRAAADFAEAVEHFNRVAEQHTESLAGGAAVDVDRYLAKVLDPLRRVAELAGEPAPATTWFAVDPAADRRAPAAAVTADQIAALRARIERTNMPSRTKTELLLVVDSLRGSAGDAERRDATARLFDQAELAATLAEGLGLIAWVGDDLAGRYRQQLHTAVLLTRDPRTRAAAAERFISLGGSLRLASRLHRLDQLAVPTDSLRALLTSWHVMHSAGADPDTAAELYDYLDRLTDAMMRYRELLGAPQLTTDMRRVVTDLRVEYQQQELALLGTTSALAGDVANVGDVRWLDPLNELIARVNRLNRVHQIGHWAERLESYGPRPAGGAVKRLRLLALDLNDRRRGPEADARLTTLQEHIDRFAALASEDRLADVAAPLGPITGGLDAVLAEQIARLRTEWASAWAVGADPAAAASRLELMDRLGRMIHAADAARDMDAAARRLNAWAAWEVEPATIEPLARSLFARVAEACRVASIGDWPALTAALDRIEAEAPLPLLVARLSDRVGPGLRDAPGGLAAALSQSLFPPTLESFARSQRGELARISAALTEAAHARAAGRNERADAILAHAGELALDALRALEAED